MRSIASQHISVTIGDAASGTIGAAGKSVVISNVSYISLAQVSNLIER